MFEGLSQLVSLNRSWTTIGRDMADIAIVAFIIYRTLLVLKGTRAMQMGMGFALFGLLYLLAKYAALATLMSVLSWLASSIILIVIVVFQNDIRRALIRVGAKAWLSRGYDAQTRVVEEVVAATTELARHRMGALIVIERDANIVEFVKSDGIMTDSIVTRELLVSLFIPESVNKTHDGAVLIRDLRIARAGLFLPMPEGTRIVDPTLGSRHRAAVGITEETDAVVVVVSEERGTVTLCFPNGMVQNLDAPSLRQALLGLMGSPAASRSLSLGSRIMASLRGGAGPDDAQEDGAAHAEEPADATADSSSGATGNKQPNPDSSSSTTQAATKTKARLSTVPPAKVTADSSPPESSSTKTSAVTKTNAPPIPGDETSRPPPSVSQPSFLVVSEEPSPTPSGEKLDDVSVPMRSSKDREQVEPAARVSLTVEVSKPMERAELPATTMLEGEEP